MDNFVISASKPTAIAIGSRFPGVKKVFLQDDVLTIEKGNGIKFASNINVLRGTYQDGWVLNTKRKYVLYNEKGECLILNFSDWSGWTLSTNDQRRRIFEAIESSSLVKPTKFQTFRSIISSIILTLGLLNDILLLILLFLPSGIINSWLLAFLIVFFITLGIMNHIIHVLIRTFSHPN